MRLFVIGYDPYHLEENRRAIVAADSEQEAVRLLLVSILTRPYDRVQHDAPT